MFTQTYITSFCTRYIYTYILLIFLALSQASYTYAQVSVPLLPRVQASDAEKALAQRVREHTPEEDLALSNTRMRLSLCRYENAIKKDCVAPIMVVPSLQEGEYKILLEADSHNDSNTLTKQRNTQSKIVSTLQVVNGEVRLMRNAIPDTYVPDDNRPLMIIAPYKFLLSFGILIVMGAYFAMLAYQHQSASQCVTCATHSDMHIDTDGIHGKLS